MSRLPCDERVEAFLAAARSSGFWLPEPHRAAWRRARGTRRKSLRHRMETFHTTGKAWMGFAGSEFVDDRIRLRE